MEETQLRKARLLGGKLGKKVLSLLPESETSMGSIARMLSLSQLEKALGEESARWVFDACRGIDFEEVRPTLKVLPKSITAFKSFPKVSYPELEKWTALLARDIMKRVETDNARNNRVPRAVTVGYTMIPGGAWIGKTFRLPFPQDKDFNSRVQRLVDGTRNALTERGHSSFIRVGFSAIDFINRPKVGIDSFFSKAKTGNQSTTKVLTSGNLKDSTKHVSVGINMFFTTASKHQSHDEASAMTSQMPNSNLQSPKKGCPVTEKAEEAVLPKDDIAIATTKNSDTEQQAKGMTDEEMARKLQEEFGCSQHETAASETVFDKDEEFAMQLQSKFDREHEVLSHVERFSAAKRKGTTATRKEGKKKGKRGKLDFFLGK